MRSRNSHPKHGIPVQLPAAGQKPRWAARQRDKLPHTVAAARCGGGHLDAVQQHTVHQPHAVADLAQLADGHVGADLAVLADGRLRVHDDVARKGLPGGQLLGLPLPQTRQVQRQPCAVRRAV